MTNGMKLFKYTISDDGFGSRHTYFVAAESIHDVIDGRKYRDDRDIAGIRGVDISTPVEVSVKDLLDVVNVETESNIVVHDYSNLKIKVNEDNYIKL